MTITDLRAARWARHPTALRILAPFFGDGSSLAPVVAHTGLPAPTVWRWARRWLETGALVVVRELARDGRPIKWYRAAAPRLFIPYESEGDALPEDVVRRLMHARMETQVDGLIAAARVTHAAQLGKAWGTLIYADRHGELVVRPDFESGRTPNLLADSGPAYLNFYSGDMHLSPRQAKQLQRELVAVLKRYKDQGGETPAFTLSVVLTPRV